MVQSILHHKWKFQGVAYAKMYYMQLGGGGAVIQIRR